MIPNYDVQSPLSKVRRQLKPCRVMRFTQKPPQLCCALAARGVADGDRPHLWDLLWAKGFARGSLQGDSGGKGPTLRVRGPVIHDPPNSLGTLRLPSKLGARPRQLLPSWGYLHQRKFLRVWLRIQGFGGLKHTLNSQTFCLQAVPNMMNGFFFKSLAASGWLNSPAQLQGPFAPRWVMLSLLRDTNAVNDSNYKGIQVITW